MKLDAAVNLPSCRNQLPESKMACRMEVLGLQRIALVCKNPLVKIYLHPHT